MIHPQQPMFDTLLRFSQHVQVIDECWYWDGEPSADGSYRMNVPKNGGGRTTMTPKRYSYLFMRGHLTGTDQIRTTCGHRNCVNPGHLERF